MGNTKTIILRGLPSSYLGITTIIPTQAKVTLTFTRSTLLQHKSSIINNTGGTDSGCNSLLFLSAQPTTKATPKASPPMHGQGGGSTKKKDHKPQHYGSSTMNMHRPNNRKDMNAKQQFLFDPTLQCTYCTHPRHSVKQCDTKCKAALLQQECTYIAIEHPLPPVKMLLVGSTDAVHNHTQSQQH
ncbi:uncharacterized protein ACA1_224460 [Acanthamoeba castellanii str. Neff]|uniref:Uncharacterized protein n=1 Tax=Acanthamoeba castellanii (strain ATCC 30010 / Neff) TaxID=1257118 RepID=L8GT22_ACACF|nr:uncharacterized protein ACA1_224460 [Acanthamoeba castellanii str. Neff]ELR16067.1 hypothetical protein ACA1_224460 [Acanthamoeba castellanii str. Neff]